MHRTLRRVLVTIVGSIYLASVALAEPGAEKLAGVHPLFKQEFEFLSPVYGISYLRSGVLENLYHLGDRPRENSRPFDAEDPTVALIREVFNVPPGDQGNFLLTKLETKPAYYFKSSTIGKILDI